MQRPSHSGRKRATAGIAADAPTRRVLKRAAHGGIRLAHSALMRRPLESRLAIYFHQLEPRHWNAFRQAIGHFTAQGYRTVGPDGFVAAQPGDRCLFLSFDDNFRFWHQALDMLRELNVTATFYVNTSPFRDVASGAEIERYLQRLAMPAHHQTLTRDELKAIRDAGHVIGCHSHSHDVLSQLPRDRWNDEIRASKDILETLLGQRISDFSWPFGMRRHFSPELRRYCSGLGFTTIASAISGCQKIAASDPLNIHRTDWRLSRSLGHNLVNLRIDGRAYAAVTGGSVIG